MQQQNSKVFEIVQYVIHLKCVNLFLNPSAYAVSFFAKTTDETFIMRIVRWQTRPLHVDSEREREMFYLTMHSTHFIYGYMASDIWLRTILIVRKETRCRHIGYSYRLTSRVLLYAPSHRQDNTYHGLCYTSRGALAGTRNSSMGRRQHSQCVQWVINRKHITRACKLISSTHNY